jgi:hypothetical protein
MSGEMTLHQLLAAAQGQANAVLRLIDDIQCLASTIKRAHPEVEEAQQIIDKAQAVWQRVQR